MDSVAINPMCAEIIRLATVEPVYSKKVDLRHKEAMISFLSGHATHDGSYSNNVKISSMPVPQHLEDEMYRIIREEYGDGLLLYETASKQFTGEHKHLSYELSGRSNGHLELRFVRRSYNDRADTMRSQVCAYRALSADELSGLDTQELRDLVRDVMAFDAATDQLLAAFIELAECRVTANVAETDCQPSSGSQSPN